MNKKNKINLTQEDITALLEEYKVDEDDLFDEKTEYERNPERAEDPDPGPMRDRLDLQQFQHKEHYADHSQTSYSVSFRI